jgi:hypothetical protein
MKNPCEKREISLLQLNSEREAGTENKYIQAEYKLSTPNKCEDGTERKQPTGWPQF